MKEITNVKYINRILISFENFKYMSLQHNFKKLRNSLLRSGSSIKQVLLHGHCINWSHFRDAYEWDKVTNSMRVYHKLRDEHINLEKASKMRNALANDILSMDMHHLMQASIVPQTYIINKQAIYCV